MDELRGWRPICTAPKDRDLQLAGQWLSGHWEVRCGRYLVTRWPYVGQEQPTKWKPLSAPPDDLIYYAVDYIAEEIGDE